MLNKLVEPILIIAVLCGAMVLSQHMDAEASQEEADALTSREWAGQQVCGPQRTAVWEDDKTLRCLHNIEKPNAVAAGALP